MERQKKIRQPKIKRKDVALHPIYSRGLISRAIVLPMTAINSRLKETIEIAVSNQFEGKCIIEGYIKKGSSRVISYSSGLIQRGNIISFEVVFECEICFPVENMIFNCIAKNITKAGIRAESSIENPTPIVVFVAKDHHYNDEYFADVKEGDVIQVRVIGQRFELNDKYISIIGELIKQK
jgi:hypothetical protein